MTLAVYFSHSESLVGYRNALKLRLVLRTSEFGSLLG